MFALRFRDIKAACAIAVNQCADDARTMDYVNRAQERLLYEGKFKGTTQTYRFCVPSDNCIIWPREIEAIEAVAVCSSPVTIRSEWYEFLEGGVGQISPECNLCSTMIDRGEVPSFDNVIGTDKKLAVYCDRTEGPGKYINLQFYTEAGQWATSVFDGVVVDGEQIAIPSTAGAYNYTTKTVKAGGLVRVSKDVTLGIVRLYEYNTTNGALRPLAYYQPDEEVPLYRRSLLPTLNSGCDQTQVTVVAKLRFIPARTDESFLMISHREALRLACKAVYLEECDKWDDALINWQAAERCLQKQLEHYKGSGEVLTPRFAPSSIWGGGGVMVQ